jgi:iron complex outermembrane receptor protein
LYSNGLHHGAASIEIGDETLQEERLWSWLSQTDIRLINQGHRKLIFMLRTHLSYYDQFIYLVPTGEPVLTIRGAFPTFAYKGVEAVLGGFDASLKALFGPKIESTIGLELLRAQDLVAEEPLLFIPPDRLDVRVKYKINSSDEGRYIQIHAIGVREQDRFPIGIDYALPPPAYFLMGAELGWTLKLSAQSKIITALSITNAFNQSYRSYTNRLRYFADEIGRNISLVVRVPINS